MIFFRMLKVFYKTRYRTTTEEMELGDLIPVFEQYSRGDISTIWTILTC